MSKIKFDLICLGEKREHFTRVVTPYIHIVYTERHPLHTYILHMSCRGTPMGPNVHSATPSRRFSFDPFA